MKLLCLLLFCCVTAQAQTLKRIRAYNYATKDNYTYYKFEKAEHILNGTNGYNSWEETLVINPLYPSYPTNAYTEYQYIWWTFVDGTMTLTAALSYVAGPGVNNPSNQLMTVGEVLPGYSMYLPNTRLMNRVAWEGDDYITDYDFGVYLWNNPTTNTMYMGEYFNAQLPNIGPRLFLTGLDVAPGATYESAIEYGTLRDAFHNYITSYDPTLCYGPVAKLYIKASDASSYPHQNIYNRVIPAIPTMQDRKARCLSWIVWN